jgi:DNA (cytosine-5)-methyltransferase 1
MRVLDLFSGIGGFSLGLERAGMETVAFCEIEPYCQKVLKKHWPDVPIYNDVRGVTSERLKADGITGIDVITGGFPCQDASTARTNSRVNGKRKGIKGESTGLWRECARLLGDLRPNYAIYENVAALLTGGGGEWFGAVLGDLAEVGYSCQWHCIPASNLGADHERDRVWIIAYPNEAQCKGRGLSSRIYEEYTNACSSNRWEDKPGMDRVANGIPNQAHRLRGLGNSVVPQIPELIGNAIMAMEAG